MSTLSNLSNPMKYTKYQEIEQKMAHVILVSVFAMDCINLQQRSLSFFPGMSTHSVPWFASLVRVLRRFPVTDIPIPSAFPFSFHGPVNISRIPARERLWFHHLYWMSFVLSFCWFSLYSLLLLVFFIVSIASAICHFPIQSAPMMNFKLFFVCYGAGFDKIVFDLLQLYVIPKANIPRTHPHSQTVWIACFIEARNLDYYCVFMFGRWSLKNRSPFHTQCRSPHYKKNNHWWLLFLFRAFICFCFDYCECVFDAFPIACILLAGKSFTSIRELELINCRKLLGIKEKTIFR